MENNRIVYKRELTDGLEKEVVAFLNAREGGILYLGIDKDGAVFGVEDCDKLQLAIKDRLNNNIQPIFRYTNPISQHTGQVTGQVGWRWDGTND